MVRAGLGDSWACLFANDFDDRKAAAYQENWGGGSFWWEMSGDLRLAICRVEPT